MFYYGEYFNNPFAMNKFSFMPSFAYNFSSLNFPSYNFALPFTPNFNTSNFNFESLWNNNFNFNPMGFPTQSFSGISTMPTFPAHTSSSSNNIFGFLNNISSKSSTTSTKKQQETTKDNEKQPKTHNKKKSSNTAKKEASSEFLTKVKEIAKRINCDYKDLLGVINSESGLNSKAVNKVSGATGLIQFMPTTAKSLGTTTTALKAMTPIEQLDYIEKFFIKNKKMAGFKDSAKLSGGDLYSLVFLPGRAKREILTSRGENYYKYNIGLDLNKDGNITKSELNQRVKNKHVNESIFV